jgi:hypothetical protein
MAGEERRAIGTAKRIVEDAGWPASGFVDMQLS